MGGCPVGQQGHGKQEQSQHKTRTACHCTQSHGSRVQADQTKQDGGGELAGDGEGQLRRDMPELHKAVGPPEEEEEEVDVPQPFVRADEMCEGDALPLQMEHGERQQKLDCRGGWNAQQLAGGGVWQAEDGPGSGQEEDGEELAALHLIHGIPPR